MKPAVDALTNLSLDPEAQRIAWERDRNERAERHMDRWSDAFLDAASIDDLFRV